MTHNGLHATRYSNQHVNACCLLITGSHCIYVDAIQQNIQTLQHIFHILLRVICNDVIDRLNRAVAIGIALHECMNLMFGYCFCKRPRHTDDECFINIA